MQRLGGDSHFHKRAADSHGATAQEAVVHLIAHVHALVARGQEDGPADHAERDALHGDEETPLAADSLAGTEHDPQRAAIESHFHDGVIVGPIARGRESGEQLAGLCVGREAAAAERHLRFVAEDGAAFVAHFVGSQAQLRLGRGRGMAAAMDEVAEYAAIRRRLAECEA